MNILRNVTILCLLAALCAFSQTALTQTTLASAMTSGDKTVKLTAYTGVSAPGIGTTGTQLFVVDIGQVVGEVMNVIGTATTSSYIFSVSRSPSKAVAHASGAMVLLGPPNYFYKYDPTGSCTTASTPVTPWVNTNNGLQWLCSTITSTWIPGFGNKTAPAQPNTLVASYAGAVLPTGPLFHMNGTAAVTSFTMPVGAQAGAGFCIIPDAAYTTASPLTASTGIVGKVQCWTYDYAASNWYPSY